MSAWDIVELVAESAIVGALGLSGDVFSAYKVSRWVFSGNDDEETIGSDGKRTYKCGLCGEEGHNRRTCDDNVTCDGCGNETPDEVWEEDGSMVCDSCL